MIPAQPGTAALFESPAYRPAHARRNVIAWNDDGEPMVVGSRGSLEPANSVASGFVGVDEPQGEVFGDAGTVPEQVIPGGGWMLTHYPFDDAPNDPVTEPVVAWALCRDGSVRPMISDGSMAEVRSEFDDRPFTVSHPDEGGAP